MVHEMKLQAEYFDKMKAGQKIFEGRLFDEKRRKIAIGDTIVFRREPELSERLQVRVLDMLVFDSFEAMVEVLPLSSLGFDTESKAEVEKIYHRFYSREDEKKYRVVAIKVEVIK